MVGTSAKIFLPLLVFLCVQEFGSALKCHQCSSYRDALCADPFFYEPEKEGEEPKLKTDEFLLECPTDREYTLCRKIYQNVRGEERIIRSCGYEEYKKECYKTVLEEYNTYVCQCKEEGCNGANGMQQSTFVLLPLLALSWVMWR